MPKDSPPEELPVPHMAGGEFRELAARAAAWVDDYLSGVEAHPVQHARTPGQTEAMLPVAPPEMPEGLDRIFEELDRVVAPALTNWQHPMFFGYFPCNTSHPAILAELVIAGLGQQGMLWSTSPACTEVETRMLDWMGRAIGLPAAFLSDSACGGGCIQGTASESALVALVAARDRALRANPETDPRSLGVYTSTQAHSSIAKAAMVAGIARHAHDEKGVRLVPVDERCQMDPGALGAMLDADLAAGITPVMLSLTLGTTASTAVDPIDACTRIWREKVGDPWVHVDAAHSGATLVCPEYRWQAKGIELTDSFCFNPHKWLLTTFDCDLFWTRDREGLVRSLSITPEYLRNEATDSGAVTDYRDWQIPLGRRFRALKLWFVMRHYGLEGLRNHIRNHCAQAEWLESKIDAHPTLRAAAERTSNLVCFDHASGEAATRAMLAALNDRRDVFLTHAVLPAAEGGSRFVIRVAIGALTTEPRHIEALWRLIERAAESVG
ncbi:MAG: pyridoxal-dependent decarboxylase [Planctomycetota bacterium]